MRSASSEPNSFEDRAFRPRRLAAQPPRQPAQPRDLQGFDIDHELRQLLADVALVPGRLLPARKLLGEFGKAGDLGRVVAPAGTAALEHQGRDRDLPALIELADQVFLRHHDVLEKHLVEMPVTVEQDQRAHGDARRLHVDEQIADPVMLGRVGIGAHQQKAPIGEMRARGPHLLPVDDEMVAAIDGARPEAGEVAARAGFGKALAPALLAGKDARQMALFLRLGAALDQGRTQAG